MRIAIALLGSATSLISSCIALMVIAPALDRIPVGSAYFADTPIHGLTYGELSAAVALLVVLGFAIGLLHGMAYGNGYARLIYIAALIPIALMWMGFAVVTMGMGLIAFPIVVAYGVAIRKGVQEGEKMRDRKCIRGAGNDV